jgi:hypothetical protein
MQAPAKQIDEHEPVMARAVGHRVVIADHDEQHGQGEIGVVHGALLAAQTGRGIRLAALELGLHELALRGDDHEQDIGHHDAAERRTEHHVGAAAAEQLA